MSEHDAAAHHVDDDYDPPRVLDLGTLAQLTRGGDGPQQDIANAGSSPTVPVS